ncbi:MAG TPA: hypothetical protein VM939_08390 [Gemmatimonadaceae bacterium]|nr:hypothetical protein [Gemmatimonadaceae bacterium]
MKRLAFALSLVAATAAASPLTAQTRNDGPWWDPAKTGTRSGSTDRVDDRGRIYDDRRDDRRVYDDRIYRDRDARNDGQWHRESRDRYGHVTYVRRRVTSSGDIVIERARRDQYGRMQIISRRVVDRNARNTRYDDRVYRGNTRNDRWEQNGGHDNGKHNGWYKDKNKNKNKNKGRR